MRFLAWVFLILTVGAVVLDYFALGPDDTDFILRPLGTQIAELFGPSSVALVETSVSRHVSASLADNVVQPLLITPAAIIFGVPFLVFHTLALLFRRPRRAYNTEPL